MKEYQKVKGWICFKNKTEEDVLFVFKNFKFDNAIFTYINKEKDGASYCGVAMTGDINVKFTTEFIVRLFSKLMKVDESDSYYDIDLTLEN